MRLVSWPATSCTSPRCAISRGGEASSTSKSSTCAGSADIAKGAVRRTTWGLATDIGEPKGSLLNGRCFRRPLLGGGTSSLGYVLHKLARFFVTNSQVSHLQPAPPSLPLGEWQITCSADDLPHASVTEEMGVGGRRLADSSVMRGP